MTLLLLNVLIDLKLSLEPTDRPYKSQIFYCNLCKLFKTHCLYLFLFKIIFFNNILSYKLFHLFLCGSHLFKLTDCFVKILYIVAGHVILCVLHYLFLMNLFLIWCSFNNLDLFGILLNLIILIWVLIFLKIILFILNKSFMYLFRNLKCEIIKLYVKSRAICWEVWW